MTTSIGILGLASFYGPAYARRIADRAGFEVVAASPVGVGDEELDALGRPTADVFAEEFDCFVSDDIDPVLAAADAVVCATATTRRPADASRALDRGIPTLVAKPVATDMEGARQVARAASESDAPVVFTTPARYDDAVAEVGRRVAEGVIGNVHAVRASIRHDRVPAEGIEANAEHAPGEAGSTHAMAVYVADALLWLADDDPVRTTAEYANRNSPHSDHPDLGSATVRFADDALGTATVTYSTDCREAWGNWEIEVVGDDGVLRTSHEGYEGIHWSSGPLDQRSATAFGRTTSPVLDRVLDAFFDAIESNRPTVTPTADDITAAHALCDAWTRSDDLTAPVTFETWPPAE